MSETETPPGRTEWARQAFSLLLDVRIMMETGWTPEQLAQADEDTVWAIATIMGLDGEKMRDSQRGRPSRPSAPHSLL